MAFNYSKPTIRGSEIFSILQQQYGTYLTIDLPIDLEKSYNYKSSMITFTCNRCGNTSTKLIEHLLTSYDKIGYLCEKCGHLTDDQLQDEKIKKKNEAAIKLAIENGDLTFEEDNEKESKFVTPERSEEELSELLSKTDDDEDIVEDDDEDIVEDDDEDIVDDDDEDIVEDDDEDDDVKTYLEEEENDEIEVEVELDEEEILESYNSNIAKLTEKLGYTPLSSEINFDDNDEEKIYGIETECLICGSNLHFDDIDEISIVKVINVNNKDILIHNCSICQKAIKEYGHVPHFRHQVEETISQDSVNKLTLLHPNTYTFHSPIELYDLRVGKTTFKFNIHDYLSKYKDLKNLENILNKKNKIRPSIKTKNNNVEEAEPKIIEIPKDKPNIKYTSNIKGADPSSDTLKPFEDEKAKLDKEREENDIFSRNFAKIREDINPFQFEPSLYEEFKNSIFNSIIKDIKRISKTDYKVIINEGSYNIPFIDFQTGIRLICVDLDDIFMYKIPYYNFVNQVKFSYDQPFKYILLYSDSVKFRRTATINRLVKLINPNVLGYKDALIELQNNFNVFYTDNIQYVREFEEKNSITPMGKPKSGVLGLLAQRSNSSNIKNPRKPLEWFSMMNNERTGYKLNNLNEDYNTYMVASIRYIESYDKDKNSVEYHITDYTEVNSSFIVDALYLLIGGIIRTYQEKYPMFNNTIPTIYFERDPNSIPSSTLDNYIKKNTLTEIDPITNFILEGGSHKNNAVKEEFNVVYVKIPEMRNKEEDFFRQDTRMFNTATLINRMKEDIIAQGMGKDIQDYKLRRQFIRNQGYRPCNIIPVKEYLVNYNRLFDIMMNPTVMTMMKLPNPSVLMPSSGISNNSQEQINPFIYLKFMQSMDNNMKEYQNLSSSNNNNDMLNTFMLMNMFK